MNVCFDPQIVRRWLVAGRLLVWRGDEIQKAALHQRVDRAIHQTIEMYEFTENRIWKSIL